MLFQKILSHRFHDAHGIHKRSAGLSVNSTALCHAVAAQRAGIDHVGKFLGRFELAFKQTLRNDNFTA